MNHFEYYIASPFFNRFDVIVRDKMIGAIKTEDYFRPDSTEASKSYDVSPGEELAKVIYNENIEHIKACNILIFPVSTNDLGTLFEVGVALKLGKRVQMYNYLNDTVTELVISNCKERFELISNSVVNVSSLESAILLGYNFDSKFKIAYYMENGLHDNIMLSVPFIPLTYIDSVFLPKIKNYKDVE